MAVLLWEKIDQLFKHLRARAPLCFLPCAASDFPPQRGCGLQPRRNRTGLQPYRLLYCGGRAVAATPLWSVRGGHEIPGERRAYRARAVSVGTRSSRVRAKAPSPLTLRRRSTKRVRRGAGLGVEFRRQPKSSNRLYPHAAPANLGSNLETKSGTAADVENGDEEKQFRRFTAPARRIPLRRFSQPPREGQGDGAFLHPLRLDRGEGRGEVSKSSFGRAAAGGRGEDVVR